MSFSSTTIAIIKLGISTINIMQPVEIYAKIYAMVSGTTLEKYP